MISIIVAIGKNNELGKENQLLWSLPADMKHFREKTSGHAVIMGRKTFESIRRPLPKRRNVVITRDKNYKFEGIEIVNSLEEALKLFENSKDEIFIIGGAEIYKQSIVLADKLYITYIDCEFPDADTYFPFIDEDIWQKIKNEKFSKDNLNKYDMEFVEYMKK